MQADPVIAILRVRHPKLKIVQSEDSTITSKQLKVGLEAMKTDFSTGAFKIVHASMSVSNQH
jgi:hypothetical protein